MSTIKEAQKITDETRKYVDFVYATKGKTFIKIYITYSRSGQSARGAIWAYNDVDTYHDTASAQGCGYSKKDKSIHRGPHSELTLTQRYKWGSLSQRQAPHTHHKKLTYN